MSTCGFSIARSSRSVICWRSWLKRRVHRGDDEVERGEAVVGEIERAVRPDVALDAGEQPDAVPAPSSARMRAACASARRSSRPLAIASDWLWSVMAMYSSPASRAASAIVADVVLAVGLGGVHVQIAAQVGALDQAGQRARRRPPRSRRAPRAAPAESRPGRAPRRSPPRSRRRRASSSVDPEEAVLVQLEAEADGAVAQRDVVRLRAGEVLQRGAAAVGRRRAAGRPGSRPEAGRSTWSRRGRARARPAGSSTKASISDAVGAGGEDVEVAAGLAAAPQAADRRRSSRRARARCR